MTEEAKEQMEAAIRLFNPSHSDGCRCVHCEDLRHGFRAGYAAAASQWVSVEDRLPTESGMYPVVRNDGVQTADRFNAEHPQHRADWLEHYKAWLPIPKYQEEADA